MSRSTRNSQATPMPTPNTTIYPTHTEDSTAVVLNPAAVESTPVIVAANTSTNPTSLVRSALPAQLVASSVGTPMALVTTSTGMPISQAPAFLPTFVPPSPAVPRFAFPVFSSAVSSYPPSFATSTTQVLPSFLPSSSCSSPHSTLGHLATSNTAPFVVGPGFIPISSKLVQSILGGQFFDLPILIQESSDEEPTTCTLLDGQLVINPGPRKNRQITDILTWVQAFSIYGSIFCAHHPHRARDLWLYQLFIIRIAKQFRGLSWANYDKAFRRDAAARNITDWSQMNVELFNFHSAASRVEFAQPARRPSVEARGSPSSQFICRSWNRGRCSCVTAVCRYRHSCDVAGCVRDHRGIDHYNISPKEKFARERPGKRY